ncbi:Aste57867_10760 [Aphanomyces stellatus]|uniref:Aste57867_10760 protein n=1 Tax=Aphanomyces stellatus TaxID=120398 RepID=A0A485KRR8_9STRA|nr:hypothetical protein As57867_010720 [Aphanomyces stellatus]VFT87630.1 Aste57867_10760 [Aphanomyces stellatus]
MPPPPSINATLAGSVACKGQTEVSTLLHGKNYLVDQKAFMAHLQRQSLLNTATGAWIVAVFSSTNGVSVQGFAEAWAISFGREVSYMTTTRVLEAASVRALAPRTAGALTKNIAKSALRKYARYHQHTSVIAPLMFHTAFRTALLPNAAVLLVEQCFDMAKLPRRLWLTHFQAHVQRFLAAIAGAAVGAALGTLVAPGDGTLIGYRVGEAVAYGAPLLLQMLVHREFARAPGFLWHIAGFTVYLD